MLRGGGLCVAAPSGDSSLPRVSPRIRALQDRLLDSLPADGAWECLSPAQREAIISLHRARLTRNLEEREIPTGKQHNRKFNNKGFSRYGRSRSFEDKLESETDDSGVRLQSGGTSSTSNSQNSQEDDSSDPGVKKGRFTKSPSADRILKKDAKALQDPNKRKGVTNGVGNVNKIISKQLTKAGQHSSSKITLDCRNLQEDRGRCRIDKDDHFFVDTSEKSSRGKKPAISRRNILQRYDVNKVKGTTSSEDFEGLALPYNNNTRKSPERLDRYRMGMPLPRVDYDIEIESDLTPRSDSTPSPAALRFPPRFQEERNRYSWTEGIIGSSPAYTHQELSVDRGDRRQTANGCSAKLNSSFDYRNAINQDHLNKYSSNWNTIILSNHIPIRPSRSHQNKHKSGVRPTKANSNEPFSGNSSGDSGYRGDPSRAPSSDSWYRENSRRLNGRDSGYRESSGKTKDDSYREDNVVPNGRDSGNKLESGRSTISRQDRVSSKKYVRSKSLDRNFLDESTDDESDFEFRRRTDRLLRYAKANQEADVNKPHHEGRPQVDRKYNRQTGRPLETTIGRKAKSDWDLSISNRHNPGNDFQGVEENCFRSRSNIINKWKSHDGDLVMAETKPSLISPGGEFSRLQWQRRSCDVDLEFLEVEPGKKKARPENHNFDKKKWHRRSLDGQLDMDEDESSHRRRKLYDQDWDDSIGKEMKIIQHRDYVKHQEETRKSKPTNHAGKELRQKNPRYDKHRRDAPKRRNPENVPVDTFYPKSPPCPDHGWVASHELEGGRSRQKPTIASQCPPSKKDRHKGPFRGKLKLFRSILSF